MFKNEKKKFSCSLFFPVVIKRMFSLWNWESFNPHLWKWGKLFFPGECLTTTENGRKMKDCLRQNRLVSSIFVMEKHLQVHYSNSYIACTWIIYVHISSLNIVVVVNNAKTFFMTQRNIHLKISSILTTL